MFVAIVRILSLEKRQEHRLFLDVDIMVGVMILLGNWSRLLNLMMCLDSTSQKIVCLKSILEQLATAMFLSI